MALSKISNGSIDSTVAGLELIVVNEKTASDFGSGTNFLDIANCFTSQYEDYYVKYYCQSTDATVNDLSFALETGGVSVAGATEQFSSPTFSSDTFNAVAYYERLQEAAQGYVNSFGEGFCFLGANTSDATGYFDGEVLLRNVYSLPRFSYWQRHHMRTQASQDYYEYGGGMAVTSSSAVAARGIRFFMTNGTGNYGSGTGAVNTYGRLAVYGVKKG